MQSVNFYPRGKNNNKPVVLGPYSLRHVDECLKTAGPTEFSLHKNQSQILLLGQFTALI